MGLHTRKECHRTCIFTTSHLTQVTSCYQCKCLITCIAFLMSHESQLQVEECDWEAALHAAPTPSSLRDGASMLAAIPRAPLAWHLAPVLARPLAAALLHAHRCGWPLQADVQGLDADELPLAELERRLQQVHVMAAAPKQQGRDGQPGAAQQHNQQSGPSARKQPPPGEARPQGPCGEARPQGPGASGLLLWAEAGNVQGPAIVLRALLSAMHGAKRCLTRCTRRLLTNAPVGAAVHVLSLAAIIAAGEGDLTSGLVSLLQSVRHR